MNLNVDFVTDEPKTIITAFDVPKEVLNEAAPIPRASLASASEAPDVSEKASVKKPLTEAHRVTAAVASTKAAAGKKPTGTRIPKRDNSKDKKSSISSVSSDDSKPSSGN